MRLDFRYGLAASHVFRARAWNPAKIPGAIVFDTLPGRVFSDDAGTTAATFGGPVGCLRDALGSIVATQTDAARPTYGRHPSRGAVNIYPANTGDLLSASWASSRMSRVAASGTTSGEPAVDLTATEAHPSGAFMRGNSIALPAGTYTLSAIVHGTGWFALRPTVEASFGDGVVGWFDLEAGVTGDAAAASGSNVVTAPSSAIEAVGDGYRVSLTFTVTDAQPLTMRFYLVDGNSNLTVSVGAEARIEAPQLEAGAQPTPYQRRVSSFDVTEAGQRSVYYLQFDGVDDWMQLVDPFAPEDVYTLAVVREGKTGWPGPITFGSVGGTSSLNLAGGIMLHANTLANSVSFFGGLPGWPALAGVPRVDLVRVNGVADAQAWRNDQEYHGAPTYDGNLFPVAGFDTLFRIGGNYGSGRFYGGAIVLDAIAETERNRLQTWLARRAGVTL